jgi:L,D-peptidoglycan transpeptidase YkuD (ErfK/YbiS/YcfS/YnhG family)
MNLIVTAEDGGTWLNWGAGKRRCAVGKGGIAVKGGEGDGITPRGAWPFRQLLWRPDRIEKPETILPLRAISPNDGWCDAPGDPHYNQLVKLPYAASHEELWRFDHLYDLVAVLGYNDAPVVPGKGSAIFLHLARPDFAPTAGCVALTLADALAALKQLKPGDQVVVE